MLRIVQDELTGTNENTQPHLSFYSVSTLFLLFSYTSPTLRKFEIWRVCEV